MKMWRSASIAGAFSLTLLSGAVVSMHRTDTFPHDEHAGLFPTCLGCHGGIPDGDEARYYSVTAADCARCHDGTREDEVDWTTANRSISNLAYVHAEHALEVERAGDEALECATCHGPYEPGQPRMAVGRATPEACTGCHAHEVSEHLAAGAACIECHRPLADVPELEISRVAALEQPPAHESPDFLFEHGESATLEIENCSVCHAAQSCTRCHLNASDLPALQLLRPDPRVGLLLVGEPPEWPEPADHELPDWEFTHGEVVVDGSQACANCHAEPSCRSCHGAAEISQIASLPDPGEGEPAGVTVPRSLPPGHWPGFATQHGAAVATGMPNCTSCHVEEQCSECHDNQLRDTNGFAPAASSASAVTSEPGRVGAGEADMYRHLEVVPGSLPPEPRPGYHPENFLLRHGAEAFAVQTVCSDCHSTEVFCRDCHESVGQSIGPAGGAGGAFHDAQPNWFFEHGRAARQGLEVCASCHQQTSCLRCHSAQSGLRINPHGPGFDADRVAARSTMSCGTCHSADQIPPP